MKFIKKISYLFLNTSLVLASLLPTITYANETTSNIQLEQGEFLLKTSEPIGFGSHKIENKKKIVTTGFNNNFSVIDSRGTQEGWQVTVSATPFSILEPINGWIKENHYSLPPGSLSLESLESIISLNNELENVKPIINTLGIGIDLNQAIQIANADNGEGMGEYALVFGANALSLVIDPITAKVDKVNYPNSVTLYESTITWDLISGPSNMSYKNNYDENENENIVESEIDKNQTIDEDNNSNELNNSKTFNNSKTLNNVVNNNQSEEIFIYNESIVSSSNERIITIPNLKEIESITDKKGGNIEILNMKGDDITIRLNNGYSYQEFITGEYIPSEKKEVTGQKSSVYDDGVFDGILTPYTHELSPATIKVVYDSIESPVGSFPETKSYTENGLSTILSKDGYVLETLVSGSELKSKFVNGQLNEYYSDIDGYIGFLEPVDTEIIFDSKTITHEVQTNDVWEDTYDYKSIDGYKGLLYVKTAEKQSDETYIVVYEGIVENKQIIRTYEGTVYTPDTRVYKYTQNYIGILDIPAVTETRYQGIVRKPLVDTRQYQDIYEYDLVIKYKKK